MANNAGLQREFFCGDGATILYTLAAPYVPGRVFLFVRGLPREASNDDGFVETNPATGAITLKEIPLDDDAIEIWYLDASASTGEQFTEIRFDILEDLILAKISAELIRAGVEQSAVGVSVRNHDLIRAMLVEDVIQVNVDRTIQLVVGGETVKAFQFVVPTNGRTWTVTIPSPIMPSANYTADPHTTEVPEGGLFALLWVPDSSKAAGSFTLEASGDVKAGTIVDINLTEIV